MKKKNILLVIAALAFLLVSASPAKYERLVELTVVNKSGLPVELKLTGSQEENFYYLRVPRGFRDAPTETTFTITPDTYQATAHYVELWDPVYGYDCGARSSTLVATRNVRVTILECDRQARQRGEPSILKLGVERIRHRR